MQAKLSFAEIGLHRQDLPSAANQKRKRGRPTNASRNEEGKDASNSITTPVAQHDQVEGNGGLEVDATEESSRPRKRGRPAKSDLSQEHHPETAQTQAEQPTKLRRRQSSLIQVNDKSTKSAGESAPAEKAETRARGRPRKGRPTATEPEPEAEEADDENDNEGDSSLLRRSKRNRRSSEEASGGKGNHKPKEGVKRKQLRTQAAEAPAGDVEAEESNVVTSRSKKKRNKTLPAPQDSQSPPKAPERKTGQAQTRRSRNSRTRDGGSGSTPEGQGSQHQEEPEDRGSEAESQKGGPKAKRGRPAGRRRSSDGQDQSALRSSSPDPDSSSPPPYRYIARRTRRVPHKVIEAKWSTLDPSSIVNIADLLHSVSQPTLLHVVPKQYAHAEDILEKVTRGLCKRSGKLPFPPSSTLPRRADELDFEKTQSAVEALVSQLDPLQHSVELLHREKSRAEKALEREYKLLDRLSTNARAEATQRRDQLRKVHVLVPEKTLSPAQNSLNLLAADKSTGRVFADVQDDELLGIADQISNHMESMRGNIHQFDGVLPAVAKSHALLRTTLQPHLSQKQMENILLGQTEQSS